jgi:hypothetical protein
MTNETADRKSRVYPIIQEEQVFLEKNEARGILGGQDCLGKCY